MVSEDCAGEQQAPLQVADSLQMHFKWVLNDIADVIFKTVMLESLIDLWLLCYLPALLLRYS